MTQSDHIQLVSFQDMGEQTIRHIRKTVFCQEQNIPHALDFDGQDPQAYHVLAYHHQTPCGTGRLLSDGHIGRIAVLKEYRKRGYGKQIVEALIEVAQNHEYPSVYLGSQKHAIGFYQKLGFKTYGQEYLEVGIPHIKMEKRL